MAASYQKYNDHPYDSVYPYVSNFRFASVQKHGIRKFHIHFMGLYVHPLSLGTPVGVKT